MYPICAVQFPARSSIASFTDLSAFHKRPSTRVQAEQHPRSLHIIRGLAEAFHEPGPSVLVTSRTASLRLTQAGNLILRLVACVEVARGPQGTLAKPGAGPSVHQSGPPFTPAVDYPSGPWQRDTVIPNAPWGPCCRMISAWRRLGARDKARGYYVDSFNERATTRCTTKTV